MLRTVEAGARWSFRATAFWSAVILPFVAVTVAAGGLDSLDSWLLFGSVLMVNALALYLGHPYCMNRSD